MNKLIKSVMMMAFAGAMLCIVGCGNSPESVAKNVVSCIKSADMKGASKYATGDVKKLLVKLDEQMSSSKSTEVFSKLKKRIKTEFEICEISKAKIDGDDAELTIKTPYTVVEYSMYLSKVDGDWKVTEFEYVDDVWVLSRLYRYKASNNGFAN